MVIYIYELMNNYEYTFNPNALDFLVMYFNALFTSISVFVSVPKLIYCHTDTHLNIYI